jgi:hypothetical protein
MATNPTAAPPHPTAKPLQERLAFSVTDARNILEQPDGFDPAVVGWARDMVDADLQSEREARR